MTALPARRLGLQGPGRHRGREAGRPRGLRRAPGRRPRHYREPPPVPVGDRARARQRDLRHQGRRSTREPSRTSPHTRHEERASLARVAGADLRRAVGGGGAPRGVARSWSRDRLDRGRRRPPARLRAHRRRARQQRATSPAMADGRRGRARATRPHPCRCRRAPPRTGQPVLRGAPLDARGRRVSELALSGPASGG